MFYYRRKGLGPDSVDALGLAFQGEGVIGWMDELELTAAHTPFSTGLQTNKSTGDTLKELLLYHRLSAGLKSGFVRSR
jgi:hypothetical protein